jgi:FlaA1/EpsC-like NDP-sugar epimerase
MITLEEGVDLVWHALDDMVGGEIYVKKIPSMKITDIALAVAPEKKHKIIGIRPGEKLHEQMISAEDARNTVEYKDYFVILPQIDFLDDRFKSLANEKKCAEGFSYSSDSNTEWMSQEQLQNWIQTNYLPYVRAKEESDQNAAPTQMTSTNDSS